MNNLSIIRLSSHIPRKSYLNFLLNKVTIDLNIFFLSWYIVFKAIWREIWLSHQNLVREHRLQVKFFQEMIYLHNFICGLCCNFVQWFHNGSSHHVMFFISTEHNISTYKNVATCSELSINLQSNPVNIYKIVNTSVSIILV